MNDSALLADLPAVTPGTPAQRWLARLAFAAATAAVAVPLAAAGVRGSVGLIVVGALGAAVALAAAWWFLAYRGTVRWLAGALAVAAPLAVLVAYGWARLLWVVPVCLALWGGAVAAGRAALAGTTGQAPAPPRDTPRPRHPFLIMNPRSGGGKVSRFDLVGKARALGAEVALLEGPGTVDVTALARKAVADGADLLGVAGGDGTQAQVAAVAAEHGIPFMVISAGTRNHFAMDLGLDRDDPSTCLQALTDGVELRVDLGCIGGRTFVNNASFGAYAAVVEDPAYRDDKRAVTLDRLPDLLTGHRGPVLTLRTGGTTVVGPQAVLVSNNAYAASDVAGLSHRDRLDTGRLGVLAVRVEGFTDAVGLVRGRASRAVTATTAGEALIEADAPFVPVGIDGESVVMRAPVRCAIRPGVLRVRVPRHRPALREPRPAMDWTRLRHLALPGRTTR